MTSETFRTPSASAPAICIPHSRRYTAASGSIPRSVRGNDGLTARTQRVRKQPVEPLCRKIRQVAGNDQIPRRARFGQSGRDSCQRSAAGTFHPVLALRLIRYRAQAELRISIGRSDYCYLSDDRLEQSRRVNDQRDAAKIEEPFVAAHTRAGTPRKNEAGDLAISLHQCPAILRSCVRLAQLPGGL